MKPLVVFLIISFSTINANAQLGDLFRKLGDTIDAVTKQNKVDEVNKEEDNKANKSEVLIETPPIKEVQTLKLDTVQTSNDKRKNSFGIKGIELGAQMPEGLNCVKDKYFKDTKRQICRSFLTILELPYASDIVSIDNKIVFVRLMDNILFKELEKNPNSELYRLDKKFGRLTVIDDFSIYMNDLVKNIIERTGDPKNTPKIKKESGLDSISAGFSVHFAMKVLQATADIKNLEKRRRENLTAEEIKKLNNEREKLATNIQLLQTLKSQCKLCKSTRYRFDWDIDDYLLYVATTLPEAKNDPFPYYSSEISYYLKSYKEAERTLNALEDKLDEDEARRISDINRKIEVQKNENRKKDF